MIQRKEHKDGNNNCVWIICDDQHHHLSDFLENKNWGKGYGMAIRQINIELKRGVEKMIDEKIILRELDHMIEAQQRSVDRAEQESNKATVYLESKELAAYMRVRDMINEKCALGSGNSKGHTNGY